MFDDIDYLLRCKNIERLGMYYHIRGYNLMEHSYMVGMLFMKFAELEQISYGITVLEIVLKHDICESQTQDLSYEVKNYNEKTKVLWEGIEEEICGNDTILMNYTDVAIKSTLNEQQFTLFKVCDLLDLWIFLKQEQRIGNKQKEIQVIVERCENLLNGKYKSVDNFIAEFRSNEL